MTDIADFSALLTSLKAVADIAKLMVNARDAAVVRAKALELQGEVIAAQASTLAAQAGQSVLLKRVNELETEVTELKEWNAEKEKYQLENVRRPTAPGGAAFAYAFKKPEGTPGTMHHICPNCYEDRRKSILQGEHIEIGRVDLLFCHHCGLEINLTGVGRGDARRSRRK